MAETNGPGKLKVSLLGVPRLERDGGPSGAPKGKKVWGLLAYLLLSDGPHTRSHLAELLFGAAEDPLGALRWNLAQLRKALDLPDALRGNNPRLAFGPDVVVDIRVLTTATWVEATRIEGLGCDLLEGLAFPDEPTFETWLMLERARIRTTSRGVLREAAAASLGTGRPEMAAEFATRAVALDPFDEAGHELLIRALAAADMHEEAADALERCTRIFREELQTEPSAAVKDALTEGRTVRRSQGTDPPSARAQLDLGRSAIKAGAIDTGIESLRTAVGAAEDGSDEKLLAESLFALGYALIHSVRGRDGEASALLHRALEIGGRVGATRVVADCLRELGYVEMLVGDYDRALASLDRALVMADEDGPGRLWTLAYQGLCYSDTGRYLQAIGRLELCLAAGEDIETANERAYALCLLGRVQMLRGQLAAARASLERSIAVATSCGWTGLLPWPQAMLAEVDLLDGGPVPEARARLEHALSLAEQIGDPCWEGAALHGLGTVEAISGEIDEAAERFRRASTVCVRFPDSYVWMRAYVLDALCDLITREGGPGAERSISDLQALAARTGMNDFLARAYLYRARIGDESARSTARLISREVESPALADLS